MLTDNNIEKALMNDFADYAAQNRGFLSGDYVRNKIKSLSFTDDQVATFMTNSEDYLFVPHKQ